ncbi:Adenylate kinase isoenzyme 1 [Aphelenchoides besseyi]|nr:Adenylate kinase isoenzyme 1 [Aphelenchoides besseyi]
MLKIELNNIPWSREQNSTSYCPLQRTCRQTIELTGKVKDNLNIKLVILLQISTDGKSSTFNRKLLTTMDKKLNSTARSPLVSQLPTSSIDPDQLLATARTLNLSTTENEEALKAANQSKIFGFKPLIVPNKLADSSPQLNTMAPIARKQIDLTPLEEANIPVFFIVGGPGSGKGTQCERIVAKFHLTHLSSGDLLREEVKSGSERGSQLTKIMEAGELVPLIQPCKLVIFFDVSEETLVNRCLQRGLTSGRVDDNVETIKKRLQTFNTATQPVVDHYIQKQKLVRIKGEGSVDEIFVELARSGVTLILWDSDQQLVEEAIEFLQQRGVNRVRGENVQFWSETELKQKALETANDYGRVDFLIFNFLDDFIQSDGFLANKRHFELIKRCSLTADSIVTRALLPFMLKEESGHILAITSIAGLFGSATQPRYSALAHSIVGVMKSLEFELESSGAQVKSSLICSSFLKNDDSIDE